MANRPDEPPPYGHPPIPPKPAYGGPDQYNQEQYPPQGSYNQYPPPQGPYGPQGPYPDQQYYQPGPPMGYYNQNQGGPFPAGHGPYPPTGNYGPNQGYYGNGPPQERRSPGLLEGLLAGLACCCCLDLLF